MLPDALDREGHAGNEASAADRNHHGVNVVNLEPQRERICADNSETMQGG